jgi:hypothetical protein
MKDQASNGPFRGSAYVTGQPAAAIVAIIPNGEEYAMTPLFVSVTQDQIR